MELESVTAFLESYCWVIALYGLLALIVWYGTAPFSTFKKLGVPGPAPWPFVGNLVQMAKWKNREFFGLDEFKKTYGRVCGIYTGRHPTYLITDPDLIKQICVKEFSKFHNRPEFIEQTFGGVLSSGLFLVRDGNWKRIRDTVTPTFSAFKLKQLLPQMHESFGTLVENIGQIADSGQSAEIWRTYGRLTMEVIMGAAFGVQAETQKNPDNVYTKNAEACFKATPTGASLAIVFPALAPLFRWIRAAIGAVFQVRSDLARAIMFLCNTAHEILNLRRQTGRSQRKDLLELMLESEVLDANGKKIPKLTDKEIVAQSMMFMLAGYETTSNALSFISYCLAVNPEKQEKLLQEVDDKFDDGKLPDYDTVQNMEYLDMVVSEALRLYPPAFRSVRECGEACTINGVHFPKGIMVTFLIYSLHRDPEYWPDPEKFDPERFSPEEKRKRNPYCYVPFGAGPRHCVGMRFALLEAKMALVRILTEFKFERAADTQVPLKLTGSITMSPADGIHLKIVRRE